MSELTIYHDDGEESVEDPKYMDVLLNTNEVAVNGETYSGVTQVVLTNE